MGLKAKSLEMTKISALIIHNQYYGIVSRREEKSTVFSGQNLRFEGRNKTKKFGVSALVAVSSIIAVIVMS
jgi:hypothetical protein